VSARGQGAHRAADQAPNLAAGSTRIEDLQTGLPAWPCNHPGRAPGGRQVAACQAFCRSRVMRDSLAAAWASEAPAEPLPEAPATIGQQSFVEELCIRALHKSLA